MKDAPNLDKTGDVLHVMFHDSLRSAKGALTALESQETNLLHAGVLCAGALRQGHKVIVCGNGGSATEAQHLVGELMGRYKSDRPSLAAIALNADSAILTCIGNDYSYEEVFSRQLSALGKSGDVLIVFTSSGNSRNVVRVLETAKSLQILSIGFLGRSGGQATALVDINLTIPQSETARIQECHQFLMHCLMDQIEALLATQNPSIIE